MRFLSKNLLIVILMMLCAIESAISQSPEPEKEKPFRLGASLGYSFSGYREESYSPINRYLNVLTYNIDGNIEKGNFLHSLNLGFFMGNAEMAGGEKPILMQYYDPVKGNASYEALIISFLDIRASLEYALDYRLWGNDMFPGYLGGAFRADAYVQIAQYPSITGLVSLDLHATQKWIINSDNTVSFSIALPVFGYAVRPAYAGADHALITYSAEDPFKIITLGNIISLHNYWAVFGNLKYQHKINSLLSLSLGLNFEISRINFPLPRIDTIFQLHSGISFTF